jgi:hypothetical protein
MLKLLAIDSISTLEVLRPSAAKAAICSSRDAALKGRSSTSIVNGGFPLYDLSRHDQSRALPDP